MATAYDEWLTTTPEDEQESRAERAARRELMQRTRPEPRDLYLQQVEYRFDSPDERMKQRMAQAERFNQLFGTDWDRELPF